MDAREPVLDSGYSSEVFSHVLFPDVADWDRGTIAVENTDAKDAFGQKNALSMMAKRAMAEVGEKRLRFIEPVMDGNVVFWPSAESPDATPIVFKGMNHRYTSYVLVV
jgi:hypothetical protein